MADPARTAEDLQGKMIPARQVPAMPPRFSWPLRILLAVILFDMVFRSFAVVVPWPEWCNDLDMRKCPARLPTRKEMADLAREAGPGNPSPVADEVMEALDSAWMFYRPWPEPSARARIHSWQDRGKFAVCWLCTRLDLVENAVGINQEWPMFSPSTSRRKRLARATLVYADGSERVVRTHGDPEDLTRYWHWNEEKVLDHELKVSDSENYADECKGYCNLLAHRHPENESGARLTTIRLFMVEYKLTPPGADARKHLQEQTGPPEDQIEPPFYEYDVASRKGRFLLK